MRLLDTKIEYHRVLHCVGLTSKEGTRSDLELIGLFHHNHHQLQVATMAGLDEDLQSCGEVHLDPINGNGSRCRSRCRDAEGNF
ncbi:hypothetical protein LIER_16359 [Lithospermum erythrorhizon]|uniref:Uncharacterized protein n=1 Tax=Lithospermum erythrorhizon TaxID=34254 RepID=A0AAV3Q8U5_LITER